ncbi:MAG: PAS domain S-box protein [Gemmataceae bacterium]|nr:PAS domain S-box protein [Gemmataceae bacterium]
MPERQQLVKEPPRARPTYPGIRHKEAVERPHPWQALFDNAPEAMLVADRAGMILEANPAACQLHGWPREQLLGVNFIDLAEVECRPELAFVCLPAPLGERAHALRCTWMSANGAVPVELHVSAIEWLGEAAVLVRLRSIRESLRLEQELRRSEKRFRALFDSNPAPMWVCDAQTLAFLAVNQAALQHYGFTRAEFLRMTVRDLSPVAPATDVPEDGGADAAAVAAAAADGSSGHAPDQSPCRRCQHITKDGTIIDVETTAHTLPYGDRKAWLVLITDVTQRLQAERALREQQALLENIIAHIPGAVFWKDRNGVYLGCNDNNARDLGRKSPAEVIGLTDFDMPFSRAEAEFYRDCDRKVMQARQPLLNIEEPQHRPDGSEAVLLTSKVPLHDDAGQVIGVLGVYTDITERKRAEQLVEQRERLFRAVIEAAGAVPYTRNYLTDQFDYIGPGIESLLGYRPEELTPDVWQSLAQEVILPGRTQGCSAAEASALFRQNPSVSWHSDVRVRTKSGEERWLFNAAVKMLDARGEVVSAWGLLQDITERRRIDEQLRQSQKMEAIGRLAGGIAHDFNNLLTVINGYGDLVLRQLPPDDPYYEPVQQMVAAGGRAAKLTGQLLAFSRKAILAPRVLDLHNVVADMKAMLRRLIGEDIELETTTHGPAMVKADPGHVEQIILNLVINARDAMPQGGKMAIELCNVELDEAYARTQPDAVPGHYVMLTVTDTGIGMDKATQARIFEPFFSRKGDKGTGLGLATVYGAVRQNGGHITVASEPGRGASFKVYLPRLHEPSREDAGALPRAALPRGTETVLLAEDEQAVRDLAGRVLSQCGYHVLAATDGGEAMHLAQRYTGQIDLLLTDVVMPKLGGRELAASLQKLHPHLKVIYLSGYTDDAVIRHGILEHDVPFVQKPFAPLALAARVREVLDERDEVGPDVVL